MRVEIYEVYENSGPYRFFKKWDEMKSEYITIQTKKGTKTDEKYMNDSIWALNHYNKSLNAVKRFRRGDLTAFSELIETGTRLKNKDIDILKKLINRTEERAILTLNGADITLTPYNIGKYTYFLKNLFYETENPNIEAIKAVGLGSDRVNNLIQNDISTGSIKLLYHPKERKQIITQARQANTRKLKNRTYNININRPDPSGLFFRYLNTSIFDLTVCQIYREKEIPTEKIINCFFSAIIYYYFSNEEYAKIQGLINIYKIYDTSGFPRDKIYIICNELKIRIKLYMIRAETDEKGKNDLYMVSYGKSEYKKEISIALYKNHYFPYYDIEEISKYAVDNYMELKNINNFMYITHKTKKGNYKFANPDDISVNSLYLVHKLFLYGVFVLSEKIFEIRSEENYELGNIAYKTKNEHYISEFIIEEEDPEPEELKNIIFDEVIFYESIKEIHRTQQEKDIIMENKRDKKMEEKEKEIEIEKKQKLKNDILMDDIKATEDNYILLIENKKRELQQNTQAQEQEREINDYEISDDERNDPDRGWEYDFGE